MLELVAGIARRVIENGGETYRAEQLLSRVAKAAGLKSCNGFVTPTGVIVSAEDSTGSHSLVRHIARRGINLGEISRLEDLVREFEAGTITLDLFKMRLGQTRPEIHLGLTIRVLVSALIGACFSVLFGGGPMEFGFALAIAPIVTFSGALLDRVATPAYFASMGNAAIVVFLSLAAVALRPEMNLGALSSGPLMLLVPGIAITNSVRDTIEGDLVSGLARGLEAFIIAAALAIGAGFALKCGDLMVRFAS